MRSYARNISQKKSSWFNDRVVKLGHGHLRTSSVLQSDVICVEVRSVLGSCVQQQDEATGSYLIPAAGTPDREFCVLRDVLTRIRG